MGKVAGVRHCVRCPHYDERTSTCENTDLDCPDIGMPDWCPLPEWPKRGVMKAALRIPALGGSDADQQLWAQQKLCDMDVILTVDRPGRHPNILYTMVYNGYIDLEKVRDGEQHRLVEFQGFVDERGNFMTREEAFEYAVKHGQIRGREDMIGSILTSEDLW